MNVNEAKKIVAESGMMLLNAGLSARTWGNISCKTGADSMVITPSGLGYEGMSSDDIASVNIETGEWEGKLKPSSEKGVHISAFKIFSDVEFVIHTHQSYASAIGLAGFEKISITDEERALLGGIELAGYGLPGTKKLANNISTAFLKGAHTVLMAHHGAVVAGKNREEAFNRAVLLEEICKRNCKGQPESEINISKELEKEIINKLINEVSHVRISSSQEALLCAQNGQDVPAELDDTAQMIGTKIPIINNEITNIVEALKKNETILVRDIGAISKANTEQDLDAMSLLATKSCICFLHTRALGINAKISFIDARLMRFVYKKKYSKKIEG